MTPNELKDSIHKMGAQARHAALKLSLLTHKDKNIILQSMADAVRKNQKRILLENKKDLARAHSNSLSSAMIDRLTLNPERVQNIANAIEKVIKLPDPCGEILEITDRPNGLKIKKIRVPIGTIGIIFESRPNVTVDAAVLCLKSGNATLLRGGKEALFSNIVLAEIIDAAGTEAGMPQHAIQIIPVTDRESVRIMAQMDEHLDLIIPRGGKGLIETVISLARVPVIKHYDGICHMYIDQDVNEDMAIQLTIDSKTQKPSVCNALETLLVHESIAPRLLPKLAEQLIKKNTKLICDPTAQNLLSQYETSPATDEDWTTEYLDYILSIKIVHSVEAAVEHINRYGSKHSDAIVTSRQQTAQYFINSVDTACVYHNASTRFSDGEEFGFGAEIGVSTDKLHARGPMGLKELTSYQFQIYGNGQTKA